VPILKLKGMLLSFKETLKEVDAISPYVNLVSSMTLITKTTTVHKPCLIDNGSRGRLGLTF